jgi:hypothetical protein
MAEVFGAIQSLSFVGNEPQGEEPLQLLKGDVSTPGDDNQFNLLTFGTDAKSPSLVDPQKTSPTLEGNEKEPDVRARIELVSLHLEDGLGKQYPRATMRFDIGKDERSSSRLKPLFWCIAAGLDLAGGLTQGITDGSGKKYRTDFDETLGRPVEIPGGLAQLRFELAAHQDPPWWQEIFKFFTTRAGQTLVSALGFPGIVKEAIDIVDAAFDKLGGNSQLVFKSAPMSLAMSAHAVTEFQMGNPFIQAGVLNKGYAVLVQRKHLRRFTEASPRYLAFHDMLVPAAVSDTDFLKDPVDQFRDTTYAIVRVKTETMTISGTL